MITHRKRRGNSGSRHQGLVLSLSDLVASRNQGLLNQVEYEEKLDDLRMLLPSQCILIEVDLRDGGTRFFIKRSHTGEVMEVFDFRRPFFIGD
jgi:hypothetical protein